VTLHQILVATVNEARDVRRRLHRDPKVFEQLAHTLSRGPEAASGGLMGTFSRGELPPELEQAAFALAPGALSDVVQSPLGFHVLRSDARVPSRPVTLDESRERIRTRLQRQKSETAALEYVRGLMARAKVNHEAAKTLAHGS
jgi:parvulin-like peptidyl-prolyl isomerase